MSAHRQPYRKGDFFLEPFRGKRSELLVRLVKPWRVPGYGFWRVYRYGTKSFSEVFVPSLHRCSPSLAKRILKLK